MSTTRQKYSLYRDDTLIASDLPYLAAIEKFAREDARREYSQARAACYVITGSSGFKRVGSHSKGTIRWEDQSPVHARFGTPSINRPSATPEAVQPLSRGALVSPSKPVTRPALARKVQQVLESPGVPPPDSTPKTCGFTQVSDEGKPPGN